MKKKLRLFIDQKSIVEFVSAVEKQKNFKKCPDKIFRHLISELGELDSAIYEVDKLDGVPSGHDFVNLKDIRGHFCQKIGDELLDIIFLSLYMADTFKVDLNGLIPGRMEAIAKKYKVQMPKSSKNGRR